MSFSVLYVHDFSFYYDQNGGVYTAVGLPEKYFDRFFESGFDTVTIFSRTEFVTKEVALSRGFLKIENENIKLLFRENGGYARLFNPLNLFRFVCCIKSFNLVTLSTPSVNGTYFGLLCLLFKRKYTVEVAGDTNMFDKKKGGKIFGKLLKQLTPRIITNALGAAYVSKYLKAKYYCKGESLVSSNVNINEIVPSSLTREYDKKLILGFAGGLNERKGIQTIIEVAAILNGKLNFQFILCGGHQDKDWKSQVEKQGLSDVIQFAGILNNSELDDFFKNCDLYIQPSLAEGIPRATIEAMSYSLPCIATQLPGFFEILDSEVLFEVDDSTAIAKKIYALASEPEEMLRLGKANAIRASDFLYSNLHKKRVDYYKSIRVKL
ncbi:glycosyltransferase family 4 protein [Pseudoalteromonas sp. MB41]|uniref:glycosyltransferase family 4 protein n=1 Tax=Pseudoalteromonas sp. MB41 TaxID=2896366 RepID=UPI001E453810|nr:glycosyltransferase family 4 protein [Pseudoalteromonas sp. MB41]MCC9661798.1 glycosyltransferase family 4 protein [Pseudoalteromonas sp. MB41]